MAEDLLPDNVNVNKIEEGLFLGNLTTALCPETLEKLHISHILTIDSKPLLSQILDLPGMNFLFIQVNDMSHEDLLCHFQEIYDFITAGQMKGNVLVHCYFGVSRSACAVICFLMKKYALTLDEAFRLTKSKRRFIHPNSGFMAQLDLYQRLNYSLDPLNISYKIYRLEIASQAFKKEQFHLPQFKDVFASQSSDGSSYTKCRLCRQNLFAKESLIPHVPTLITSWRDPRWDKEIQSSQLCLRGVLIMPQDWMKDALTNPQGKLYCPKCRNKIGSFNWIKGCQCPCLSTFVPGFLITPSKVDVIR